MAAAAEVGAETASTTKTKTPWEQHFTHMKKTRDYTSLDEGFVRFAALHPLFEEAATQKEALTLFLQDRQHAGSEGEEASELLLSVHHHMLSTPQTAGNTTPTTTTTVTPQIPLESFHDKPRAFHRAMFEFRCGWTSLADQMRRVEILGQQGGQGGEGGQGGASILKNSTMVVDMSDLQASHTLRVLVLFCVGILGVSSSSFLVLPSLSTLVHLCWPSDN